MSTARREELCMHCLWETAPHPEVFCASCASELAVLIATEEAEPTLRPRAAERCPGYSQGLRLIRGGKA